MTAGAQRSRGLVSAEIAMALGSAGRAIATSCLFVGRVAPVAFAVLGDPVQRGQGGQPVTRDTRRSSCRTPGAVGAMTRRAASGYSGVAVQ